MTAKQVRAARKKLGITQEELARKLGITSRTVSKWEKDGITKPVDALALRSLLSTK